MENKKYICPTGKDYTEYILTEEDLVLFDEMCEAEKRTVGIPLKDCYEDVVLALKIGRQLEGGDPNTIVIAKTPTEGLAKLQAFSRDKQN